uniref:Uncharacterized protein n=1 Tax=Anguilla anguilla TaxID=7936 RepID=A0A0E9U2C5_ANGAN
MQLGSLQHHKCNGENRGLALPAIQGHSHVQLT